MSKFKIWSQIWIHSIRQLREQKKSKTV